MATTHTTPTRQLVICDEVVELGDVTPVGDLWAACAPPGDGPEFRFTARPLVNPLWSLRRLLRLGREGKR